MRTLTLTLRSDDGRLMVETPLDFDAEVTDEGALQIIGGAVEELAHRLDVLERDGPWKPEVQNSLQPAPKASEL